MKWMVRIASASGQAAGKAKGGKGKNGRDAGVRQMGDFVQYSSSPDSQLPLPTNLAPLADVGHLMGRRRLGGLCVGGGVRRGSKWCVGRAYVGREEEHRALQGRGFERKARGRDGITPAIPHTPQMEGTPK